MADTTRDARDVKCEKCDKCARTKGRKPRKPKASVLTQRPGETKERYLECVRDALIKNEVKKFNFGPQYEWETKSGHTRVGQRLTLQIYTTKKGELSIALRWCTGPTYTSIVRITAPFLNIDYIVRTMEFGFVYVANRDAVADAEEEDDDYSDDDITENDDDE